MLPSDSVTLKFEDHLQQRTPQQVYEKNPVRHKYVVLGRILCSDVFPIRVVSPVEYKLQ